jgi:polysaccharide export outer membrane protein
MDALAAGGGVRQPVGKLSIQVTRGMAVQTLPLERVILEPKQNIRLMPGDVVTVMFQPFSYVVLGATGKNEEINFEVQGISLSQALARAGGLQDARSDARGVFVFRLEDPALLASAPGGSVKPAFTLDGKVPVVYQLNLRDPMSFLAARSFPMRDKDVIYVANAASAELQKVLNLLASALYPIATTVNVTK